MNLGPLACAGAAAALLLAPPVGGQTVAVVHARAFTLAAPTPVDDATIVMAAGRIVSVAARGVPPAGSRILDARGAVVTPGLVAPATQLGLVEVLSARDTDDRSVSGGALGPSFDVHYAINPSSTLIPVARADGVTRAMVFPGAGATQPFAGQGAVIRLRPGPDVLERARAAMFATIGDDTQAGAGGSRAAQWGLLRNALAEARRYAAARPGGGPRDQLLDRPDVEALAPVLARAMPLAIRADRASDIREAIRLAADERVRVVVLGGAQAWCVAGELAAAGIPVVLDPEVNLPQLFDWLGARLDNAAILSRAGVRLGFSVAGNGIYLSYDAGIAMREGAGIAVANGLPYSEALKAITSGPADIWGIAGAGRLVAGADADLVVWDGDPLEPSSAATAVFVAGVPAALATRQTMLRDRYAPGRLAAPMPPAYP